MTRFFGATSLSITDIERAFALIQALHPGLTLDGWRTFATPLVNQPPLSASGLVGIKNEAAYLCGLFVYRAEPDLECDRVFTVEVIAALDILDAKAVVRAMMEAVQSTAERLSCRLVRIRVTRNQDWLALYLKNNGLERDGQFMSLAVAPSRENG